MFRLSPLRLGTLALLLAAATGAAFASGFAGLEMLTEILILAILVIALDMVAGFGGMVSLCHGALMGAGAYAFAMAGLSLGLPVWAAMLFAVLFTGAVGWIVGAICAGSQGIYFIMVTLAFGQMGYSFVFESPIFGGDDGLAGLARPDLSALGIDLNTSRAFALYCLAALVLVVLAAAQILRSGLGRALVGIRDNERRMRALGLTVWRTKAHLFGLSGMIAGVAGVLAAQHVMYISPGLLAWTVSGEALVVVILGGLGTFVGPIVGAVAFVVLRHEVSAITPYWHLVVGLILIAVVMSRANGIFGFVEDRLSRMSARRAARAAAPRGEPHDA
ncbi:branched-chain amino acid ABC transporter permease [Rhodovulum euryhalinum]|uniref:Amino acid/amide ABC transporter membrane protein 2 (HAAT family) n=1 Tax=Rhodovulum euryhalinum TaxID=35805 RepID=A0A4R2KI05_9RHOB|nr:branched-chain amino acid ABC transporter permease [Rhodovulum euryhalinum]TCO70146.1 amino acid/amide ABC transporter membrane protein 2 (HAAT family) [Rhodovulum euryhalinum]